MIIYLFIAVIAQAVKNNLILLFHIALTFKAAKSFSPGNLISYALVHLPLYF